MILINIFYNEKQKNIYELVRKKQITEFKKRQRKNVSSFIQANKLLYSGSLNLTIIGNKYSKYTTYIEKRCYKLSSKVLEKACVGMVLFPENFKDLCLHFYRFYLVIPPLGRPSISIICQ